jgi:hypothetical protein
MYLTEREVITQAEIRADRLATAEHERVLSSLRGEPHYSLPPRYASMLIWLGSRLESWGTQLQSRYAVGIPGETLSSEGSGC